MSEFDLFRLCLAHVLKSEGGYVNHPNDKGGATNKGITQAVFSEYLKSRGLPVESVREITPADVERIYATRYWNAAKCREFPPKVAAVLFDAAVNHGVTKAIKLLQRALGLAEDGIVGPKTLAASEAFGVSEVFCKTREKFYRDIVAAKPDQAVFLRGWLNRIRDLRTFIRGL
jgi:lysozyme family protein